MSRKPSRKKGPSASLIRAKHHIQQKTECENDIADLHDNLTLKELVLKPQTDNSAPTGHNIQTDPDRNNGKKTNIDSGGSKGDAPGAPSPTDQNFLDVMQFFGKFDKIVCWHIPPLPRGLVSLLRGILDPPLIDTDDTQTTQEVTTGDKTKQQLQIKTNGIIKRKCVRNFKCKEWSMITRSPSS